MLCQIVLKVEPALAQIALVLALLVNGSVTAQRLDVLVDLPADVACGRLAFVHHQVLFKVAGPHDFAAVLALGVGYEIRMERAVFEPFVVFGAAEVAAVALHKAITLLRGSTHLFAFRSNVSFLQGKLLHFFHNRIFAHNTHVW